AVFSLVVSVAVVATVAAVRLAQEKEATDGQRQLAEQRAEEAQKALTRAEEARAEAEHARTRAEDETYVTRISLAAARVERGQFGHVEELLESCPRALRHWEWGRLKHLCHLELLNLPHPGGVTHAAFSPDGKRIATAGGKMVRVWDVRTGK